MNREHLEAIAEDPKAFLLRGKNTRVLIAAKEERIEDWRRRAESITVAPKEDYGTSSLYKQSTVEQAACNIADLQAEITGEVNELISLERDISAAINELLTDDRYKTVMELKYVHYLTLEEIAVQLKYAFRWVQRLNKQALLEMKEAALSTLKP